MEPFPDKKDFIKQEKKVMRLLTDGYAGKIIGKELNISIHTVHGYFKSLRNKTHTHNMAGLVAFGCKYPYLFADEDEMDDKKKM